MRRIWLLALVLAFLVAGCYGGADADLTETGKGRPDVTATVPPEAKPGQTVEAVIEVANPGPGDMASVVVAFSRLGDPKLPIPIVEVGRGGRSDGIADVEPAPDVISPDGVVYRFGSLAEGESMQITFELVMPDVGGDVGNAVTVYDGDEPGRARGARISISLS